MKISDQLGVPAGQASDRSVNSTTVASATKASANAVALMVDNLEMAQETLKIKGFTMITERDLVDEE